MTLLPALAGAANDRPDAVRVGGERTDWETLGAAAGALAGRIAGAEMVAVHATASLATVVATVAAITAGVPLVPVPADAGPVERAHLLADSGAALMLAAPGTTSLPGVSVPLVPVDVTARSGAGHPEPAGSSTAMILYTSGTTGPPKGVVLTRDAIAAGLDGLADAWDWEPGDTLVHGLPLYHVHGLILGVLGALRVGSRLVHTGRPTPEAYAAAGGTLYFGVPTVWSRLCRTPAAARALTRARLLVSGSAALPRPVWESLCALTGHAPVERYGMTETLITLSTRAAGQRRPGYVGTPLPGVATRLVGDDGGPVDRDGVSIGELQVQAPTLFAGYLGQDDATRAAFTPDGWLRTGDAATIGPDGWHRIVGRVSTDLISSGGFRIGAGEVEDALAGHPGVRHAAVVGAPDPDLGQQVVAYVVGSGVSEQELIDFVASRLSVHKRPRRIHLVDRLPRNALGKVRKTLLTSGPAPGQASGSADGSAEGSVAPDRRDPGRA